MRSVAALAWELRPRGVTRRAVLAASLPCAVGSVFRVTPSVLTPAGVPARTCLPSSRAPALFPRRLVHRKVHVKVGRCRARETVGVLVGTVLRRVQELPGRAG